MGRRSINTTKSGKYMNPTDQARKEARKLELKKNKKQRQMVRAAVLKGKDPYQILEEMEKIDQMEFNVYQASPFNEKVLKDKRKKLRDTLERVLNMYYRDDPDKWADLKKKQNDYEHKRIQLVAFYESVKSAQQVSVDEIPLPQMPEQATSNITSQIPLPTERKPEHTIYSIATALKLQALGQPIREPPGCPPGPPPDINSDGEEVEYAKEKQQSKAMDHDNNNGKASLDEDETTAVGNGQAAKPTSVQQKMVAISGQSISDFMKEMESVQKKKEGNNNNNELEEKDDRGTIKGPEIDTPAPPGTDSSILGPSPQQQQSSGPLMFPGSVRLPPAPPPGRPLMPPGPPPGLPPPRLPLRLPPAPPRLIRLPGPPPPTLTTGPPGATLPLAGGTPNVLSAAPQLINRQETVPLSSTGKQRGATISAKPQIRNLSADVTRFVPSTLRVKREDSKKQKPATTRALVHELKQKEMSAQHVIMSGQHLQQQPTKDDAYMQFMKEMQGLL